MRSILGRALAGAMLVVAATLAATSISRVPALSGSVNTLDGQPLPGAYLAYRYMGSRFNFVDSLSYYREGRAIRTGDAAEFHVPGFVELHRPLDGGLDPWIEWVYVPELHHFFGPIGPLSESRPGLVEIDRARGVIRLADLSDDPERWSRTIRGLDRVARRSYAEPASGARRYRMPEPMREALEAHLHDEFRAFMQRHANTPRAFPEIPGFEWLPEDEQESRRRQIENALSREPLWGQLMERLWPELAGS